MGQTQVCGVRDSEGQSAATSVLFLSFSAVTHLSKPQFCLPSRWGVAGGLEYVCWSQTTTTLV